MTWGHGRLGSRSCARELGRGRQVSSPSFLYGEPAQPSLCSLPGPDHGLGPVRTRVHPQEGSRGPSRGGLQSRGDPMGPQPRKPHDRPAVAVPVSGMKGLLCLAPGTPSLTGPQHAFPRNEGWMWALHFREAPLTASTAQAKSRGSR